MPTREEIEVKYGKQIDQIEDQILDLKDRISDLQGRKEDLNKRKESELSRISENAMTEAHGIDAIKSKWIDTIADKGHTKEAVKKFVYDTVKNLEDQYGDDYEAIVGTLKKILKNKYDVELGEAAITTTSMGSATDVDGGEIDTPNSAYHASYFGMNRRNRKKKKIKKQYKEYVENFEASYLVD